ncbi:LysR family transcriptional regulator [Labrys wisconsinensis]|uniref:DNA-binding transcriptional LysR family regulator n=1 Tax=Labrys wisconsinensis TaxID=425677 RepID=A0ABU0JBC7_9HYPH|nr:LysR family transcriptional regulator [Labrys wisconsinensis]MDQ0470462.1 DNA-binding transcriptional LysR family regulator [Labrys wisconsinensis]
MTTSPTAPSRVQTSWDDYRYVQAVADAKSLVGAAEKLGVNHSTVFRRINAVEEVLGTRLFERGRQGYALTAAGEEMVALAGRMDGEITSFERRIAGRDIKPSGDLRVTTNDTLMVHLMTPVFASFLKACPDIRLDVVIANASLNLSKRDADVAIRATSAPPETLVGRKICVIAWAVYGQSPFAGRDMVDALGGRWVGFGENLAHIQPSRWMEREVAVERVVMRLNTVLGVAEAIEAGVGFAPLPCFIGDQISSLARISEPLDELSSPLWLLTHPDLKHSARVRVFMDHAWDALARRRGLIEGKGIAAGL